MAFYSPRRTKCFNTQRECAPSGQTQRYNTLNKFGFSQQSCPFSGLTWYKPLDRCFLAHVFIPGLTNLYISWKLQNPNRLSALAAGVALQLLSDLRLCLPRCFQPGLAAEKGRKRSQQSGELAYVKPHRLINYCWHCCWHTPDLRYTWVTAEYRQRESLLGLFGKTFCYRTVKVFFHHQESLQSRSEPERLFSPAPQPSRSAIA